MEDEQQNEDIMQYMQHQSQTAHPQANQSMHQQDISNDDFELMPFQMLNQQAQILFSSGNASDCANNPSSNKWNFHCESSQSLNYGETAKL